MAPPAHESLSLKHRVIRNQTFKWLALVLTTGAAGLGLRPNVSGQTQPANAAGPLPRHASTNSFSQYAGSDSCRECHQEEYKLWEGSHHCLAERAVKAGSDRSAFSPGSSFGTAGQTTDLSWSNGQAWVTFPHPKAKTETYAVERVIGVEPLRQFLVAFPGGRYQALETAFDPHSNQWFNVFGAENRQPGEWGHWTGRGMNWNYMCAACHNTALRRNYDPQADTYRTTMAEAGVGCEACHGPMAAHNQWQRQYGSSGRRDPTVTPLSKRQVMDNCGYCHARRTELAGGFIPGDDFLDRCELEIVDHTPHFYADGQVRDEDYEYAAFLGSRMAGRGVTCADCHDSHSAKTRLPGNWLCLRCHAGGNPNAPVINPVAHSHHKVFGFNTNGQPSVVDLTRYTGEHKAEGGGECINCHMPQTVYMQRHSRHDHGMTIPDPLLTVQFAIPNACNRCHQDKDAAWALRYCKDWYGAKMERPGRHRAQVLAAAQRADTDCSGALLTLLRREDSGYWRAVEAGLLEAWATQPAASAALEVCLHDTNALVRTAAAGALSPAVLAAVPGAATSLAGCLADPCRSVRVSAASSLLATLAPASRAGKDFQEFLDNNADEPSGQLQAGIYAFARDDLSGALDHLQKAVTWDPYSIPSRQELAVALSAAGRPRDALVQLQQACRLAPGDASSHYQLALALNEAGDLKGAAAELATAVGIDPLNARAWYNLGLAQSALDQPAQALESLQRAEAADPRDADILYARATVLARLGRKEESAKAARKALQLRPGYPEAQALLQALEP
jgi:tetratricopeptide (TPR) repeat protein